MKASLNKKEGLARQLQIEVPSSQVNETFNKVFSGVQSQVTIKGFRKGKAPMSQVKSLYADRIQEDVLNELISRAYSQALDEHSLDPITQPHLQVGKLAENQDFEFSAEFEVRPEVTLKKYEGLPVDKEKLVINEDEVQNILNDLQARHAETGPVLEDRPAQEGDLTVIDFSGTVGGEPLEGGQAQDFSLELGSKSFIPGFEEGIVGMKVGSEKVLSLAFPEDYHNKDIAGKGVDFKVTLKKLEKKVLPELTDKFAADMGEFESLEELKEAIRKELRMREEDRIQGDLRNKVLSVLTEHNPVEVPATLKKEQKERLVQDIRHRLQQQGLTQEQAADYEKKWDQDFDKSASNMVQASFLVDALATKLNIRVSPEEVERKIKMQADSMGLKLDQVREYYDQDGRKSQLAFQITEEKVIDFLIEKAEISEVEPKKDPEAEVK